MKDTTMDEIHHPITKALTPPALALLGHSYGEWASILACICSILFIIEWVYKRVFKPFGIKHGWLQGKPRGFLDSTGMGALDELARKEGES